MEHADGNDASDTSSSSSDSEVEEEEEEFLEDSEGEDDVPQARVAHKDTPPSSSSGYESEDSSAKEIEADSSDDGHSGEEVREVKKKKLSNKPASLFLNARRDAVAEKDSKQLDEDYILKSKSVYKCRLCPRIICLTEESLNTHLKSKRHVRSTKLLNEGRLKLMLNSDGEIEEDGETHAERLARTAAAAQMAGAKKKNRGRQRQRNRLKKKKEDDSNAGKAKPSLDIPPKKRLKGSKK